MMELVAYAEHESPVVYIYIERERSFIDKRRMLMLSLQYLLQRCARGGRMIVEDMCYEMRCFGPQGCAGTSCPLFTNSTHCESNKVATSRTGQDTEVFDLVTIRTVRPTHTHTHTRTKPRHQRQFSMRRIHQRDHS